MKYIITADLLVDLISYMYEHNNQSLLNRLKEVKHIELLSGEMLCALADACTPNTETGALNYLKFALAIEHNLIGE